MGLIPSFTVYLDIYDVLYLSYLIPIKRLRPAVPDAISFAIASEDKTIISLVMFRSKNVRASFFPFLRFEYDQANIRTYVLDPITGKPAVFFLQSGITSPVTAVVTRILGIPWQSISMRLNVPHNDSRPYLYAAEGNWEDAFNILLDENRDPLIDMTPFQTPEEATKFLTGPSVGFYGSSHNIIRFEVEHSAIKPLIGKISAIHFPMLVHMGLVTNEELYLPHSALIAPHGQFSVSMPPAKVYI
jgi:hypothetical protein